MVFITEGFFEVAIESWPQWDLNPRPLNSVQNYIYIFDVSKSAYKSTYKSDILQVCYKKIIVI